MHSWGLSSSTLFGPLLLGRVGHADTAPCMLTQLPRALPWAGSCLAPQQQSRAGSRSDALLLVAPLTPPHACLVRLCEPLVEYFRARGGEMRLNSRLQSIQLDEEGLVDGFRLTDGTTVRGDLYVSAMPGVQRLGSFLHCRAAAAWWIDA